MKATELRIGNWVMYSSIIKVNENKIRECVDHPDRFAPIPLTEEWLERFGFEKINGYGYRKPNFKGFIWSNPARWKYYDFMVEVKHVHQLQNLYFALTGEELTQNK